MAYNILPNKKTEDVNGEKDILFCDFSPGFHHTSSQFYLMKIHENYYPHFFTATILDWKHLLKPDKYKNIIISSLEFLVEQKRVAVQGFVIMSNHMHLVWQISPGHQKENVQRDFMKYTAQKIKADLRLMHPNVLPFFKVKAADRSYQVWERNSLSTELYSKRVLIQKLNYTHINPVRAGLVINAEDYRYSSASYYKTGKSEWKFLSHYEQLYI